MISLSVDPAAKAGDRVTPEPPTKGSALLQKPLSLGNSCRMWQAGCFGWCTRPLADSRLDRPFFDFPTLQLELKPERDNLRKTDGSQFDSRYKPRFPRGDQGQNVQSWLCQAGSQCILELVRLPFEPRAGLR